MAIWGGKYGYVAVGAPSPVRYRFGRWSFAMDGDDPEVTNFESGGAYEDVDGIDKGTLDISGPYDAGNMPLQRGLIFSFTLGVGPGFGFTVLARVKNITPSQDVKGKAELKITCTVQGPFVPAVL
jgi:hypothetical protein